MVMERIVSIVHYKVTLKSQVNVLVLLVGTNDFILMWMSQNLCASQFERAGINDCRFICQSECVEL